MVTANAQPEPVHGDGSGGNSDNGGTPGNATTNWRVRKREQDRRAQRAARERNRRRIAELESTVDSLSRHGAGQQIASLKQQLEAVQKHKDELSRALSMIQKTVAAVTTSTMPAGNENAATEHITTASSSVSYPPQVTQPVQVHNMSDLPEDSRPSDDTLTEQVSYFDLDLEGVVAFDSTIATEESPVADANVPPLPNVPEICDCIVPPPAPQAEVVTSGSLRSTWQSANDILREPCDLSPYALRVEEELGEDLPIRVVLYGWDYVQQHCSGGSLPPLWDKMRRIDELQFSSCQQVERLAILTFMHMLLRFHINPTHMTGRSVPQWYLEAPSHIYSSSYAIKFFVWPGVRNRFIFSQHRYCSNRFWELFVNGFRIAWPYALRDCYKKNMHTGRYSLSSDFHRHTRDIRCWTMSADFLNEYPEIGD
ncbi:hypothetical protein SBRCBS47491_003389 [Sporothrix bragantina]|uniref:BZIP transcription factor n=1 Tax=Sporothrix bragantina TaxID=671064 RepID=A0ABP0BG19_9PEZI